MKRFSWSNKELDKDCESCPRSKINSWCSAPGSEPTSQCVHPMLLCRFVICLEIPLFSWQTEQKSAQMWEGHWALEKSLTSAAAPLLQCTVLLCSSSRRGLLHLVLKAREIQAVGFPGQGTKATLRYGCGISEVGWSSYAYVKQELYCNTNDNSEEQCYLWPHGIIWRWQQMHCNLFVWTESML